MKKGRLSPPNCLLAQSEMQNHREKAGENKVTSGKEIKKYKQLYVLFQNTNFFATCIFR